MYFDSHAHYNDEKFNNDREQILEEVYNSGITRLINAGYSLESSKQALEIAEKYEWMYAISGISPNDVPETTEEFDNKIIELETLIHNKKVVAIGEIGLDYYWNKENKNIQQYAFIRQIELANKYDLPIVIHSRDAIEDTIKILKENEVINKGVFHCCPLNNYLISEGLKLGFLISFAGPVTFKNSKNAEEVIKMVPLEKILVETDSPYLSPEPNRGKRNDSRNVKYIVQKIAEVKEKSIEEVAKATYQNAVRIFRL